MATDTVTIAGTKFHIDEVTRGGVTAHVMVTKLGYGDDNSYTGDVSRSAPLPVDAALRSDVIQNSGSQLTPKFAVINLTATGTVVAAVTAKKIRVLSLFMAVEQETGDENYTFKSGAAGTALTGTIGDATSSGGDNSLPVEYSFSPVGHFETASGSLLELSLSGTTPIAQGSLVYVEV